ncbi:MAG: hypothetical protein AB8I08_37690 [Sandaracinaceae bacterium]
MSTHHEDREFEAVPTAMHRPQGSGLADFVPAWQQPDEDNKRTAFFSREEVLRKSRAAEPAPLSPPPQPVALSRPVPAARIQDAEEELPTVIVDSLPSPSSAAPPAAKAGPSRFGRYGASLVGVLCGAIGIGVGVSAAFAIERGPSAAVTAPAAQVSSAPLVDLVEAPVAEEVVEPTTVEEAAEASEAATEADETPTTDAPEPTPEAPLAEARAAIDMADVDVAQAALDRARAAQANPAMLRRLEAELTVLRGDGALSVPRLSELSEIHDDAVLHVAYGRLLVQAERDEQAMRAFRRALVVDPTAVDAHLGLAGIRARAFAMPAARRHLREAREALEGQPTQSARLRARLQVAEAMIALESGSRSRAEEAAQNALDLDPRSAEAHFLLARMTDNREATRHLRFAVAGRAPAPVSTGMLASRVRGEEACELAARYLDRAPRGYDAPALRRVSRRCGG